ncbi:MAG: NAD(P)H-dependent oxidoreductase [Firmicutes bacterium]|nr:NAD(P)H-dependent oxidoreductase [Bacillota bacterium]
MAKVLTAFFSRADENYFGGVMRYIEVGNTEVAVEKIKERIDTDIFKIEMKTSYAKEYKTCIDQAKKDKQNDARPELVSLPDSIDSYDTIILAYPNYWSTMPMAVFTFLDAFSFKGKTILPLCTNEGSGMGTSEGDIKKICAGADVKKGLPLNGSNVGKADAQIENWLKTNNLI